MRLFHEIAQGPANGRLAEAVDLCRKVRSIMLPPMEVDAFVSAKDRPAAVNRYNNGLVKRMEESALRSWASENGLEISSAAFDAQWQGQGCTGGAEHHIYYDPDSDCYVKRNHLAYHDTWLAYFQRLIIHNRLFAEVAYRFEGVMTAGERLFAVALQPWVRDVRAASWDEVAEYMGGLGFVSTPCQKMHAMGIVDRKFDEYIQEETGIIIYDLHQANMLVTPAGNLAAIDPIIRMGSTECKNTDFDNFLVVATRLKVENTDDRTNIDLAYELARQEIPKMDEVMAQYKRVMGRAMQAM